MTELENYARLQLVHQREQAGYYGGEYVAPGNTSTAGKVIARMVPENYDVGISAVGTSNITGVVGMAIPADGLSGKFTEIEVSATGGGGNGGGGNQVGGVVGGLFCYYAKDSE